MNARWRLFFLVLVVFAPLVAQILAATFQHYGLGLVLRFISHVVVPVIAVVLVRKMSWSQAFWLPVRLIDKKALGLSWRLGFLGSVVAAGLIFGAYWMLGSLVDFSGIAQGLQDNFGVSRELYPWVVMALILFNPFVEEYFWRGFVYRAFRDNVLSNKWQRVLFYLTGFLFALHHVVIIQGWFVWWQWFLVVVFLAAVGVMFNWLYEKTGSILSGLIIHAVADVAIVLIGFRLFGYF